MRPEALEAVAEVIDRWELHWAEIGVVTATGCARVPRGHARRRDPASFLTDECPRYEVERSVRPSDSEHPAPVIDRGKVYEQYDQLVGSRPFGGRGSTRPSFA